MNLHAVKILPLVILAICGQSCEQDDLVMPAGSTKCITHRGLVDGRPEGTVQIENSLAAFRAAHLFGADGTEFDVRNTRDGNAILLHNATLEQTARSKPGLKCELFTDIQELDLADIRDHCELKSGEPVPTLEDALREIYQWKVINYRTHVETAAVFKVLLDFKNEPNDFSIGLIKKYYGNHYADIISLSTIASNIQAGYRLKAKMPNPLFMSGNHFIPGTETGYDGIEMRKISNLQVRLLQEKGKGIAVFDVVDDTEFRRLIDARVNYITTDLLKACLRLREES